MRFTFRKSRLVVGLAAGLTALLGTAGVSYTLWTQTLTVNNVVNTGSMNIHFTGKMVNTGTDPYFGYNLGNNDNGTSSCSGAVSADLMTANTTLDNGYPGASCAIDYYITNEGTVPGVLKTVAVAYNGTTPVSWFWYTWCALAPGDTLLTGTRVAVPTWVTDHMGQTTTVSISFVFDNYYPGEAAWCGTYTPGQITSGQSS